MMFNFHKYLRKSQKPKLPKKEFWKICLKIFYRHFARWIPWDWGRQRDRLTDWRPCLFGDCDVSHHGSNLTSLVRNWKRQEEKTCYSGHSCWDLTSVSGCKMISRNFFPVRSQQSICNTNQFDEKCILSWLKSNESCKKLKTTSRENMLFMLKFRFIEPAKHQGQLWNYTMRTNLPKTLDQLIFCKYTLIFSKCSQIY